MSVRPVTDLFAVFIAPALWFAHFGVLYGAEALLCTPPATARGALVWIGALVTVVTLAVLAWFVLPRPQPSGRADDEHTGAAFLRSVELLLALLAALGVVWTVFPITVLPVCAT